MIGKRLAEARKKAGLGQAELAAALGGRYDYSMISHVEAGRKSLREDGMVNAARELGVSLDYLVGLTDDPTPAAERNGNHAVSTITEARSSYEAGRTDGRDANGIRQVEVLEVAASAGSGADVYDETPTGYLAFRSDWLEQHLINPANCNVISVRGDSMEPTLPDGCSILVDRSRRELNPKRIYVLRTEDGLVVKRVDRNRDGWWLVSDNTEWLPVMLTEEADIVGEVRWVARTLD